MAPARCAKDVSLHITRSTFSKAPAVSEKFLKLLAKSVISYFEDNFSNSSEPSNV